MALLWSRPQRVHRLATPTSMPSLLYALKRTRRGGLRECAHGTTDFRDDS
jgi:hypothetical protein